MKWWGRNEILYFQYNMIHYFFTAGNYCCLLRYGMYCKVFQLYKRSQDTIDALQEKVVSEPFSESKVQQLHFPQQPILVIYATMVKR